jgi:hypothetical protein
MKNRVIFTALLFCVVAGLLFSTAEAQNKRIGTAAATELLIPVGARDLAMGGATIANSEGVESIHWNPAGLGLLKHSAEGMFSSMSYIADINVNYGAAAANFGEFGTIALSIRSVDFGDIPLTTNEDPEGRSGRIFSPAYVTVGLSYGRALTDAISTGLTLKLVSEQMDRASATGFAFDFGVQYHGLVGVQGLQLGVAIKNIGPQMKYDGPGLYRNAISSDGLRPEQKFKTEAASFELPSLVEIGLAYRQRVGDEMMYSLNGSFTNNNLYLDQYSFGGELGYMVESVQLFGRAGYAFVAQAESDAKIFGPTFGVGITYSAPGLDITLDYAFRQVDLFDNNNVFSLKLGF